jgi:site-specific DNA recombinase
MNKTYFAYIRVSTAKQGEHGVSLVEQKSAIEAYALRNNLTIATWFEEMETAAKQGRQLFTKMLAELRAGKGQGLIVHKIDRSARNLRDWADVADLLDAGVDVRFVNDNFDLLSTGGRLSADIVAAVSASYIRNLREEVKKGLYGRLKQGLYPWQAPIGYLDHGGGKVKTIDPVKGPLVRYLFERYGSNTVSFRELRLEMQERGLTTTPGKPLSLASLTIMLHNPFYAGVIRVKKSGQTFAGIHEPLISTALYERVQTILDGKTVPKEKKHRFLLRQMVHCENCGRRTLTGENHKDYTYYRCHHPNCRGLSWSASVLEETALEQIRRIRVHVRGRGDVGTNNGTIGGFADLRNFVDEIYRERGQDRERLRTSLNLRVQQVDVRIAKLTDLLLDESIDRDTFGARKEKFLLERRTLLDELTTLDERSPLEKLLEEFEHNNRELLRYESMTDAEKRQMLDIVCSKFAASRKSVTFTLRSPYLEIAEIEDSSDCTQDRNNILIKKVVNILRSFVEKEIETGRWGACPMFRPHVPTSLDAPQ